MTREQIEGALLRFEGQAVLGGQIREWPTLARTLRDALRAHRGEAWAKAAWKRLKTVCDGLSAAEHNHHVWTIPAQP